LTKEGKPDTRNTLLMRKQQLSHLTRVADAF